MSYLTEGRFTARFSDPVESFYTDYELQSMIVVDPPVKLPKDGRDFVTGDDILVDRVMTTPPSDKHPQGTAIFVALSELRDSATVREKVEATCQRIIGMAALADIEGYHTFNEAAEKLGGSD